MQEVEKPVKSEEQKDQAQQDTRDENGNFHDFLLEMGNATALDSDASHLIQVGLQELAAIDGSRHQLRSAAGSNKCYVRNPDKSQDGTQIRIDKVKCRVGSPRLIDAARRDQNGGLFARKQALRPVCSIAKVRPPRTTWSIHSLSTEGMLKLCIATPITYSSACSSSAMHSSE